MSTWVDGTSVIGTGSLDGFAIGALMSAACVLAITALRRARARRARVARDGGVLAAEAFGAGMERVAQPEELGAHSAAGREGRGAGGYRSRHRLGDPIPGGPPWGAALLGAAFLGGPPWDGVPLDSTFPGGAFPGSAFTGGVLPGSAFTGGAFPGGGSRRGCASGSGVPE